MSDCFFGDVPAVPPVPACTASTTSNTGTTAETNTGTTAETKAEPRTCFFDTASVPDTRFFVVDAVAHDRNNSLVIDLHTKTVAGHTRRLVWHGRTLTFYVRWPGDANDVDDWVELLRDNCRGADFTACTRRRTHLMGYEAHPVTGQAVAHLYVEIVVASLEARRFVLAALRPRDARSLAKFGPGFHELSVERDLVTDVVSVCHGGVCAVQQAMVAADGAPGMWIDAYPSSGGAVETIVFRPDDATPMPVLRILAYDIETGWEPGHLRKGAFPQVYDPHGRIIQVGMTYMDGATPHVDRVLCLGETGSPCGVNVVCVPDESALLDAFGHDIARVDPDAVTGYNIHGFDVDWLVGRAEYITLFRRYADQDAAVQDWRWAQRYMHEFPTKAPRDTVHAWLRARQVRDGRAHTDTRGGSCPDVTAQRLAVYRTAEQVTEAWRYFGALARPTMFWRCGRYNTVSSMTITTSKTGADQHRFDMEGRLTVDLFGYVKEHYGNKLKSFSLKTVALHFDPETPKIDLDYHVMFSHFDSRCPERKKIIAEYCSRDCRIPAALCDKLKVFLNLIELSRVTGVPASQITKRGQQVRCLAQLYRIARRRGMVMNVRRQPHTGSFRGAVVQEPRKGYYQNGLIYLDFASLYPNVMRSYNLCFATYVYPDNLEAALQAQERGQIVLRAFDVGEGRTHHFVQSLDGPNLGVVPELLNNVLTARAVAKRAMKEASTPFERTVQDARQLALKITANSMYGFTGVPEDMARLPLSAIAETTTAMGRELITKCAHVVPERYTGPFLQAEFGIADAAPLKLVYGDTDSVIFETPTRDLHKCYAIGLAAEKWLNDEVLRAWGRYLAIECEEICSPYVQIMKKRYISRAFPSGPNNPSHVEYKGIELVRKDSLPFTRQLYQGVIDIIFGPGIGTGPSKTVDVIARDIIAYLGEQFHLLYTRDPCFTVMDFTQTKTLQNRSRYKFPDKLPHVVLMTRINREVDAGTISRQKFNGGDQITYVIRSGDGDITSRAELPERVASLDNIDMLHYLTAAQRALNKLTAFFLPASVEAALYATIRSTLFLRQTGNNSLLDSTVRLDALQASVAAAVALKRKPAATAPVRSFRQRTLTMAKQTVKHP